MAPTKMRLPAERIGPAIVPNSDGLPKPMRHLMNESNVPVYHDNSMTVPPPIKKQTSPVPALNAVAQSKSSPLMDTSELGSQ